MKHARSSLKHGTSREKTRLGCNAMYVYMCACERIVREVGDDK